MTDVARMPKLPKITGLKYLTNDMLDYLDFRHVHGPANRESNPLHKCKSKTIENDSFYMKKEERDQGSVIMFSCSEIL